MSETNSLSLIANRKRRSAAIEASAKLITQKRVRRQNVSVEKTQEIGLRIVEEGPNETEQDIGNEEESERASQVQAEEHILEMQNIMQGEENSEKGSEEDEHSNTGNDSEPSDINLESVNEDDSNSSESHAESNESDENRNTGDEEERNVGNEEDTNESDGIESSNNENDDGIYNYIICLLYC